MAITGSLRGLGDNVSLVLTIYEGKNFVYQCAEFKNLDDADVLDLIAVGSLSSVEEQTSDPVQFNTSEPDINTEFEWRLTRKHFQSIRSRKIPLKVNFFAVPSQPKEDDSKRDHSERKLIGSVLYDLKEVTPISDSEMDASYVTHASWKTLINTKALVGRSAPVIKTALTLERRICHDRVDDLEAEEIQSITSDGVFEKNTQLLSGNSEFCDVDMIRYAENLEQLFPKLNEEKGYFLLGNEADATEMFYFNVFITYGKNLQLAISRANAGSSRQEVQYYFTYNLFGIDIQTEAFGNLNDTSEDFLAERASARILTNSATIEKLITELFKVSPFKINLCSEQTVLSSCNIDLSKILGVSQEKLERGDLIEYDGVAFMDKVEESDASNPLNVSRVMKRKQLFSESNTEKAHIGIRFSVGKTKDEGLGISGRKNGSVDNGIEEHIPLPNVIENMDIDEHTSLKLNNTLKKVNEQFEENFVRNSFQSAKNDSPMTKKEMAIIQNKDSSYSELPAGPNLKRQSTEQISTEINKSPRQDHTHSYESPHGPHFTNAADGKTKPNLMPTSVSKNANAELPQEVNKDYSSCTSSVDGNSSGFMVHSPPEITTKVLQKNLRKPSVSPPSTLLAIVPECNPTSSKGHHNLKKTGNERIDTTAMLVDSSTTGAQGIKSNVLQHKFKFVINLESIALTLDRKIDCVIKYNSQFSPEEISTKPAFVLNPSKTDVAYWFWTPIQNGYCEFNFSSKLSSLQKRLKKHILELNVYHEDENALKNNSVLIGKALLDLSMIFTTGNATSISNEIRCNVQASVLPIQSESCTIGQISCNIALRSLGEIAIPLPDLPNYQNLPLSNGHINGNPLGNQKNPETIVKETPILDLAALDIENWKHKQKEKFQNQLNKLEQHHMNTLSDEWNKRYSKITFVT